jgi:YaiO family outer membrane protein
MKKTRIIAFIGLLFFSSLAPLTGADGRLEEMQLEELELQEEETDFKRWILVPMFSYSVFNKGRESWQEESVELFYQFNRKFLVGAEIDIRQRPPSGTDVLYSAMASWYLWDFFEIHGGIRLCPNPNFSPTQSYNGGFQYQVLPRVALLFDYDQMNFGGGDIEQLKPGLVFWFSDVTFITLRYARGWVFSDLTYNYYSSALNLGGMPGGGRLILGFAYGTDPDIEFGTGDTSLSNAYIYTVFYNQPITRDLSVFAGAEYVYRLNDDNNGELYQQLTPTVGLSWKF